MIDNGWDGIVPGVSSRDRAVSGVCGYDWRMSRVPASSPPTHMNDEERRNKAVLPQPENAGQGSDTLVFADYEFHEYFIFC